MKNFKEIISSLLKESPVTGTLSIALAILTYVLTDESDLLRNKLSDIVFCLFWMCIYFTFLSGLVRLFKHIRSQIEKKKKEKRRLELEENNRNYYAGRYVDRINKFTQPERKIIRRMVETENKRPVAIHSYHIDIGTIFCTDFMVSTEIDKNDISEYNILVDCSDSDFSYDNTVKLYKLSDDAYSCLSYYYEKTGRVLSNSMG